MKMEILDSGQQRLQQLGYKQELKRDLSVLSNFAFSFSIVSIVTGVTSMFNTGLLYGGPIAMIYGWIIAGFFIVFVSLSMAEICSAYPTSGGLYFWTYQLAGREWGPFASWITGWFNIMGQWALTTSIDYALATLVKVIILLSTGGANGGGYNASKYEVIGIHGGILVLQACMNSLSIHWVAHFGNIAALWNFLGVFILMFLIPAVSPTKATCEFIFHDFNKDDSYQIDSTPYIFLIGLLMCQYTITGYDASANMSEETKSSDKNGPYGIIGAVIISLVVGWGYLLGMTFAISDWSHVLDPKNDANGYAMAQVFYDAFKNRYGSGTGGIICLGFVAGAMFFSGMTSITSNSRIVYALSRDGLMPFSRFWHVVNKQDVPLKAVWLSTTISFIMALTSLGSLVAFQVMVSITAISLYIAYVIPSFFRVTLARNRFKRGPFNLGSMGVVIGWVAVLWVVTISVLFSLPIQYPITARNLNYTPIMMGGIIILITSSWLVSARFWFMGPVPNVENVMEDFS